ncbi:MAG: thermonuclease family protein [Phycisphaerae bacterium]|nr:thermonuclease family protein [Phycisphaerae bacterium]
METTHNIILGDSRCMDDVADESVHLAITSPPYWQLKDYGHSKQIGFDDSYEEYINNLNLVWNECHRVLHKGCRLCVNIGDQFARSVYYGRYKVIPIRTEIIKFCETIGFDYMGAVIWQKVTTCNTTGGATIMGSFPNPRNGILKIDYEFILIFKKYGTAPKVSKSIKENSKMTTEEWNQFFTGHWNFSGEKQDKHIAMFPEELPKRLIKMFSFVGDTVLDPFLGSGTTSLAAKNLDRNSVGYEINQDFQPTISEKLGLKQKGIFDDFQIFFEKQKKISPQIINKSLSKLPYVFKDTVQFNKKIDPKKLQFGSKIDNNHKKRDDFHKIAQILSSNTVILDNGLKIKLLGVEEDPKNKNAAIDFLDKKTKGQKVFMKFDTQKYDANNTLLCYLYLQNKTFLNSHLIKNGYAKVDRNQDYKYKTKFIKEWSSN